MKLLSLLVSVALASGALATPTVEERGFGFPGGFEGRPSKTCLYPAAATSLVSSFKSVLTNPDRQAANATAQIIIADNFTETSDSIDTLAGYPLGSVSFTGKQVYINNVVHAPPIPAMETLDIFFNCTAIVWYWVATGLGNPATSREVKGINLIYTTAAGTQILDNKIEFNSIAWGYDTHNAAVCAANCTVRAAS